MSSTVRRARRFAGTVKRRARDITRAVRVTKPARAIGDRLLDLQYRLGSPGGRIDRAISWLIVHDLVPPDERTSSVNALVELFFDTVEAAEVDGFVEAGAKDSSASRRAASKLGVRHVVAFEANPYTHRRFVAKVSGDGVQYEHLALSDANGQVEFLVRLDDEGNPIPDGQGSLLVRPDHTPGYETVVVDAVRLDDHLADFPAASVAMWIDVEGASSQVLGGAPQLLERTDVVMIEVEERRAWIGQEWLHADVVRFFAEHGLEPIARDTQSRRQLNVVFVSDRARSKPQVAAVLAAWRERSSSPPD